jgi:uncharacterized membrane protein
MKALLGVFLIVLFVASPAYSVDTQDAQIFITGFNAYMKKDYQTAINNLSEVLTKYPETPLRDMTLFWLSNSHYKVGNLQESGKYMAQFFKEYPNSSLKETVDENIVSLAGKYQRGEPIANQPQVTAAAPPHVAAVAPPQVAVTVQPPAAAVVPPPATATATALPAPKDKAVAVAQPAREKSGQQERVAKAETARLTTAEAGEKSRVAKPAAVQESLPAARSAKDAVMLAKAVDEYKRVIDHYPGTQAAVNAAARLKSLGMDYQPAATAAPLENGQVLSVEVGLVADLEFTTSAESQAVEVGKRHNLAFELVNRGNSADSFIFESAFPKEYRAQFTAASAADRPLSNTGKLQPGERFKGVLQFEMPPMAIDGERKLFTIRAFSEADVTASQSRAVRLTAKAPVLRSLIKTDIAQVKPGEQVPYRLVLLNVGSAAATGLTLRLTYPPQYEPVTPVASGLKAEGSGTLLLAGLALTAGESREIAVAMRLKENALAKEELFLRADMVNPLLNRTDSFISLPVLVKAVSGITVHAAAEKLVVVPGQSATVSLAVTNSGNLRDSFTLKTTLPGNLPHVFYRDNNRDGIRQAGEEKIETLGPMAPGETVNLILEIASAASEKDGSTVPVTVVLAADNDPAAVNSANVTLAYSRPVLNLSIVGKGLKVKPGEVSSFELSCINVGSSMAKVVDVRSHLPEQLEVVASEPVLVRNAQGEYVWRFEELGAGEKRNVRVSYRIKPGTPVGTSLALRNTLTYQDQTGNSY